MPHSILYITGVAWPLGDQDAIHEEKWAMSQDISALRSAGHNVFVVGDPEHGFNMTEVNRALKTNPEATTIFISAHGNVDKSRHYIQAGNTNDTTGNKSGQIWASTFYKGIAKAAGNRPVNIFMTSCDASYGAESAVEFLPRGSTLITFDDTNQNGYSYVLASSALRMAVDEEDNLAERLFLSVLFKGLGQNIHKPRLSISSKGSSLDNVWDLWDVARSNILAIAEDGMNLEPELQAGLGIYSQEKKISAALRTLELYVRATEMERIRNSDTPISLEVKFDETEIIREAAKHKLLGAICALGYFLSRDSIGAFQTWGAEEYTGPNRDSDAMTLPRLEVVERPVPPGGFTREDGAHLVDRYVL